MGFAATETIRPVAHAATASDYISLMKPRVMSLVVFTGFVGLVAAPGNMNLLMAATAIFAIALGAGAAAALNMWFDSDIDSIMARTVTRPIPSGRVSRADAFGFGIFVSILSVTMMAIASNLIAAALLAFSIFFYAVVYTMWLKRSTPQNIVIGGAAGAFPPVIGWAAATGAAPVEAWLLFGLIFLWTPPHFWALSLWTSGEYSKAGVPMLPVTHGAPETRRQILIYSIILAAFGLFPMATSIGGPVYLFAACLGGGAMVYYSMRVFSSRAGEVSHPEDLRHAKKLFATSIFYLFGLFAAVLVDAAISPYLGPTGLSVTGWFG